MEYGYVRVSGKSQNEERQLYAMEKAGIARERLYIDKQSGKDFNRPEYQRLLRKLREGDALFVQSIDRLGRNYEEILEHWGLLTRKKKVGYRGIGLSSPGHQGEGQRTRASPGNSWPTWCCRYWPMWHRKSGKTYVRDRRRASPWRRPAGSAGGEKRKTYLLISRHSTRPGKMGR